MLVGTPEVIHSDFRKLLKRQISQRLGSGPADADPIKTHPFFKHISWADVISRKLDPPFKPVLASDVSFGRNSEKSHAFSFFRTMSVSLTPTSPVRPQWTPHAAPRSPRASISCSRASPTWLHRSLRSSRKTSSGQGVSAVQGSGPTAGDLILLRSTPERISSSSIQGGFHWSRQRDHGRCRALGGGCGGLRVHHHLPRH